MDLDTDEEIVKDNDAAKNTAEEGKQDAAKEATEEEKQDAAEKTTGGENAGAAEKTGTTLIKTLLKVKKEPDADSGDEVLLFVPDKDSDSETGETDADGDRVLFERFGPKRGDDVVTVGWIGGRKTQYLNRFGPRNAAIHRVEGSVATQAYENDKPETEKVSNPTNRFGDKKLPNGNLEFTKRHIRGIYGVAWEGSGEAFEDDLTLIDPEVAGKDGDKWIPTYVWIGWDVAGTVRKAWEPR
ncbi:hypothetical protein AYL99_11902 [Fonsecaea erecta]|uniref:Uncharacterized protein n=1 Tax=Fonsecaea erecta TaxID=1367422 RepID=A0A178Z274_9EURO|nr:hypothetical protein AYL99_11902 [Fonsecaea erecta]OAP53880.1 hypothetical protein AYL99_11902 [Fonsecaea erecta]